MADEGELPIEQITDTLVARLRVGEDQPVGRRGFDEVANRLHQVVAVEERHDDEMVVRIDKNAGDTENDPALEFGDGDALIEDEADDEGSSGPQAYPRPIGPVAEVGSDRLNPRAGLGAELRPILERPRHGGDAETGDLRDRLQRRPGLRSSILVQEPRTSPIAFIGICHHRKSILARLAGVRAADLRFVAGMLVYPAFAGNCGDRRSPACTRGNRRSAAGAGRNLCRYSGSDSFPSCGPRVSRPAEKPDHAGRLRRHHTHHIAHDFQSVEAVGMLFEGLAQPSAEGLAEHGADVELRDARARQLGEICLDDSGGSVNDERNGDVAASIAARRAKSILAPGAFRRWMLPTETARASRPLSPASREASSTPVNSVWIWSRPSAYGTEPISASTERRPHGHRRPPGWSRRYFLRAGAASRRTSPR